MDKDSDINPTSAKQDLLEALAMTKEAIDIRLDNLVNIALMSEAKVIECFDMDKPYFNAAVCEVAKMIPEFTKQKNAGIYSMSDYVLCECIGKAILKAIYDDLLEAAGDRI